MTEQPRRIRLPDGRVPPLSEAQRARIITIDLDNPPPFIGIIRNPEDIWAVVRGDDQAHTAWVQRPDWGAARSIFNRRSIRTSGRAFFQFLDYGSVKKARYEEAVISLQSDQARSFLDNIVAVCKVIDDATHWTQATATLQLECAPQASDIHPDGCFRMFAALEHGNVVLPDAVAAAKAGFVFRNDPDGVNEPCYLVDLIENNVPVYAAALGDLTFMHGIQTSRRPTWHAAYEISQRPDFERPVIKASFNR